MQEKEPMALLEEYSKEIEMDTQIDVTNVLEKQLSAPNVKHKWLFRLAKCRKQLLELVDQKENFLNGALLKDNPLKLSKSIIANKLEMQTDFKGIQKKIKDQELLVEFLDAAVNKIFSQIGFDFKNIVELMKMEQL